MAKFTVTMKDGRRWRKIDGFDRVGEALNEALKMSLQVQGVEFKASGPGVSTVYLNGTAK